VPDLPDTDVLVVGGGPVGLAAAIEARLAGRDAIVVEPRTGAVDKACGEGLMPGALRLVREWDVDPAGHDLLGIDYRRGSTHVQHRFRTGPGRGVRRTTLHDALRERATGLGVTTLAGRADEVTVLPDGVRAAGVTARWLLACDGLHSTVRRGLGLARPESRRPAPSRFGLRRHYRTAPWSDLVEVHWSDTAEAYVTPVGPDLVGVALLGPRGAGTTLEDFPELAERLAHVTPDGPVRGAGPLRQRTTRRSLGPVRLVGDASGYVDALTGEGLRVGFAQARAAIATLEDGAAYEQAWRTVTRDYRLLTSALVRTAASPLRPGIVPLAVRAPRLFAAVVERLAR
jgi:flavin-dependent dehydrogenase